MKSRLALSLMLLLPFACQTAFAAHIDNFFIESADMQSRLLSTPQGTASRNIQVRVYTNNFFTVSRSHFSSYDISVDVGAGNRADDVKCTLGIAGSTFSGVRIISQQCTRGYAVAMSQYNSHEYKLRVYATSPCPHCDHPHSS